MRIKPKNLFLHWKINKNRSLKSEDLINLRIFKYFLMGRKQENRF